MIAGTVKRQTKTVFVIFILFLLSLNKVIYELKR